MKIRQNWGACWQTYTLLTTRKMISSGGASLRSWHQLYSRVLFVKCVNKISWFWVTNWAGYKAQQNDRIGAARLSVWPLFLTSLSTVEKGTALATCSYSTTENCTNRKWLPLPWLQLEMNKVESSRSTTQICIHLRPLSSSHNALPRFRGSDIWSALMTTFICHCKVYHVVSEHAHWVIAM